MAWLASNFDIDSRLAEAIDAAYASGVPAAGWRRGRRDCAVPGQLRAVVDESGEVLRLYLAVEDDEEERTR